MAGAARDFQVHEQDESDHHEDHGCSCCFRSNDDEHNPSCPPGEVEHHCTDPICCLLFLAALVGYATIWGYCMDNGDMARITHGYDFLGNLCGQGVNAQKPVLFYCQDGLSNTGDLLDLKHPICRESCPTTSTGVYSCYAGSTTLPRQPIVAAGYGPESFTVTTNYYKAFKQDYPTQSIFGRYCMPDPSTPGSPAAKMYEELIAYLQQQPGYSTFSRAASIKHSWKLLLGVVVLSILLGMTFLLLLKMMAGCLVWTALMTVIVACFGMGGYILAVASGNSNGFDGLPSTGDSTWDMVIGGLIVLVGVVFMGLACCAKRAIDTAIGVVEAACDCMFDLPTLLYEPLLTIIAKGSVFCFMLYGFLYLLSCGQMSQLTLEQYAMMSDDSSMPSGIVRQFSYTDGERRMIAVYAFLIYWVMEFFNALGQYVLAYMTGKWFFSPLDENGSKAHVSSCGVLCLGYATAFTWHLGTLAYGSFIIAVLRFVRLILMVIVRQMHHEDGSYNPAACCAKCCLCCVDCFTQTMEFVNKNAYMDVAVNSNDFCRAAYQAFKFIAEAIAELPILNGACFIFQMAGVCAVTAASSAIVFFATTQLTMFNTPAEPLYVQDPVAVTVAGGIIGFVVSYGFMAVFDMVADTLLFCFVFARSKMGREALHFVPPGTLQDLIANGKGDL